MCVLNQELLVALIDTKGLYMALITSDITRAWIPPNSKTYVVQTLRKAMFRAASHAASRGAFEDIKEAPVSLHRRITNKKQQ